VCVRERVILTIVNICFCSKIIGARSHGINDNSETLNNKDLESP
jgi:hypothetical protein